MKDSLMKGYVQATCSRHDASDIIEFVPRINKMINVGILGCGRIGSAVIKCWQDCASMKQHYTIKKVLVRDMSKSRSVSMEGLHVVNDIDDIINDAEIRIVINTIASEEEAFPLARDALIAGKSLVFCSQGLLLKYGSILDNLANQHNVSLRYSAALGIIRRIFIEDNKLDSIVKAVAILDEVSGFLLYEIGNNCHDLEEAIQKAIKNGFSHSSIMKSVNGEYLAEKLALLISIITRKHVDLSSIHRMKIENIDHVDMEYAALQGYSIKHVACFENKGNYFRAYVEPALISSESILTGVVSSDTGLFVMRERTGENYFIEKTTPSQAAYLICQDAMNISGGAILQPLFISDEILEIREENKFSSACYFRIKTLDNQNAVTDIMMICQENAIFIKDIIIERASMPNHLYVCLIAYPATEQNAGKALKMLLHSDLVKEVCKIRILEI